MKTCKECGNCKPDSEFYKKDREGRLDSTCKACRIVKNREHKLGIDNDTYWALYRQQKGRCGICEKQLKSKRYKAFAVDHCHTHGHIRGLLCHRCNTALGLLKDCPKALQKAIEWIKV